ncbi:hypothetical protein PLESTB_001542500 [Pleodorina starrii]|uniref:Uncharacterized protein n=1 Tax=Pleodorina starrii TaxID=330485 RepID=A0A9W6F8M7_9CHLO|nr:hypothetical protein PLESTB_001542500 [Pleodorina starrii]GLC69112.1 hypothetical protein PLESTF_000790500 [Pleodorina starrii]
MLQQQETDTGANPGTVPLVETDSLVLIGVSWSLMLPEVQQKVDIAMEHQQVTDSVTVKVEDISHPGQDCNARMQVLGVNHPPSTGGAVGEAAEMGCGEGSPTASSSLPTGGTAEVNRRHRGLAERNSPLRHVMMHFMEGEVEEEEDVIGRVQHVHQVKQALTWVVGDNLNPASQAARHAASYTFRPLAEGGWCAKWRRFTQHYMLPPG